MPAAQKELELCCPETLSCPCFWHFDIYPLAGKLFKRKVKENREREENRQETGLRMKKSDKEKGGKYVRV